MVKSILLYCFLAYLAVISEVGGRHPEDGLTQHILQCGLDVEVFLDWSGQYVRFGRIPRNRDAFARSLLCLGRKRGFLDANNDAILPTGSQVIRKKTAFCTETRPSSPTTRRALYAIDCLMLRKKSRKFNEPVYEEVGKIWLRKEIKNDYRHLARRIREITTDTYRKDLNDGLKEDFSDKTLNVLLRSISDRSANNTQHSEPTKAATDVANGFRRKRLENIAANKKVDMNKYDQFINRNFVQFQQDAPREINGEFYISDRGTIFIMDKDVEISKHMQYHKSADITQVLTQFGRLVRHRMIARTHTSADRIQFIVDTDRSKWYSDKTTIDLLELFAESERTVQGPISCLMYVLKGQVVFLWVKQFDKITDQYPGIRDTFVDSKEITRGPIHCHFYISRRKMIAVVNENVEHFLRLRRNVQEHSQEVVCEYDCEDENEIAVNVNVDKTLPEPYSVEREIYGKLYFSKSKTLLIIENNMEITEQIQFRKSADITEILSEFDRSLTEHQIIAGVRVFADKTLFTLRRPLQSYFHKTVDISGLFGEKEHIVKGPVSVLLYILKNKIVLVHMKNMQEVYSHNRDDSRSIFQELEQAIRSPLHCQLYFSRTNVIVIIDENIEYYTNLPLDKPTLPASVLQNDTVCEYDCQDEQKNIVDAIMRPNFFQHQAVQRKICDGTFYFSNRKTLFIIEKDVDAVKYMHHHKTVNISGILKEIGNLAQQKMATATYTAVDKTLFIVNTNYTFQLNKQVDVMDLFMESERIMQGPIKCLMYVLKNQVVFLYINPDDERYHEYMNARHIFREIKEIVKGPIYCDIYLSNRNINILIDENIENYMRRKLLPQQPKKYYPADGTECKNGYCKDDQNSIKIDIKVEKNLHRRKMSRWDINGNMYISSENTIIIMEKKADVIRNIQSGNRMNITDIIKNFGTIRARKVTAKTHIYKDKTYFMINNTSQNTYDETIHIEETITQKERFALGPIHCILYILQDKIVLLYTKEYLVKYPQLPNTHTIIHENEKVLNGPIPCQLYISYSKLIFVLNENIERLTLAPQYTISETAEPVRQPELVPHHNEQCDPDCDHDHNAITINVNVRKDFFKYDTIRRQIAGDLYVSETKTVIIIDKDAEVIKNIDTESTVDIQDLIDDVGVLYGERQVVAEAQVSLDRTIFVLNNSSVTYYDKAINAVDLIISEEERYVHGPVHCLLYILKDRIVLLHMKEYQETYPHLPDSQAIFDDSEEITKGPIRCRFYASQKKLLVVLDENIERLMLGPHYTIPAPPAQQRPAEPLPDDRELCGPDCDDDDEQNSITINVNVRKDFFKYDTIRRQIAGDLYVSETKTVIIIDKDAEVIKNIDTESTVDIQDLIDDVGVLYGARQVVAEAQVSLDRTIFVLNNSSVTYYDKAINAVDLIISEEERYVHGPVHCLLYILKDRIVLLHMKEYQETYPHLPDSQAIFDDSEEITKGPIRCRFYASQKKLLVVLDENIERLMLGPHYTIPAPPAQQRPAEPLPDDRELCGPDCDDDDEQNSITINVNVRKDFFKYDTIRRQIAGNLYVSETKTVIIIDKDAEVIKNIDTESTVDIQDLIDDVGVLYGARQVVAEAQVSLDRTIFVLNNSSVTYYDKAINAVDLIISEEERYVHGPVHCLLYILKDRIVLLHMKEYQETYPHLPDSQAIFDDSEEITKGPIRCRFYASQKKLLVVLDENIERLMLGPHYTIPAPPAQQRPAEPLPDDRELCGPDCDDDDEQNSITINVNVRKDFFKYDTIRRQIAGNLYVSETKTVIIIDKDAEVIKNIDTESTVDIQDLIDDVGVLYGARQVVAEAQVSLDRTIFVLNNSSVTYYDKAINAVDLIISEEERYVHGPVHCLLYILKDRIVLLHMKEYQETYPHLPDSQAIFDDSEEITKGPIRCRFYASQKKLLVVLDENIERLMLGPHYTIPAPPAQQRPAEPLPDDRELCGPDCDDDDEQNSITINVNVRKDFFKYDTIRRQIAGDLYVSETKTVIIIDKDAEVIKNIDTESTVDIQDLIDDVGVLYGARQVVAEAQVSLDRTIFVLNNSSVTYYDKAINAVDLIISEEERYVHGPVHCLLYILKDRIVLLHMKEYQETYPHLPDSQAIFDDSEEITKGPIRCRFYASQKKLLVVLDENIERLMLGPHYTIPAPPAQQRPAEPLPDDRELCGPDCDDDDEQNSITINVNVRKDFFKYDTIRRQIAGDLYVSETKTVIIIDKDAEVIKNIDTESTVDIQDLIDDVGVLYGARQVVAEAQVSLDRTIFVLNNSSVTYYDKAINAVDLIISEEERYVHGPVHCLLYILKDRIVLLHMKEYQETYPHLPDSQAIFDDSEEITKGPIRCRFYASQKKLLVVLDENIERLMLGPHYTIPAPPAQQRPAEPLPDDRELCGPDCDDDDEQNSITINVNVRKDFFKYDTIRRQIAGDLYVSETKTVIIIDKDAEVIKNIDTESTVDIQDLIDDVGVLYGARQVVAEAQVSLDRTIFVLNNSSVTYYDKAINAVDLIISEEERYVHGPVHCLLYILKDRIVLLHMKEYQETYPHLPDSQAIFDDSEEITKGPIRCRFYASQKKLLVVLDENIERLMLGPHYTIPAPPAQQRPAEPLPDDRELCGPDCDDDDEQNSITINVNVRKDFFKYDTIRRQIAGDLYVSETKTVIIIDKDAEVIKNIDTESTVDIQDLIDDVGVLYGARQVVAEAQVSLDRTIFVLNNSSVTYYDKAINAVDLIISEEERYVHGPVHCLLYILKDRIVLLHMKEYQETYPHLPDSQAIFDDSEEITKGPIRCRFYASQKKLLVVLDENIERLMLGPHYTIPAPPAQQRPAEPLPDDRELCGPDCDDDDEQNSITINVNVRKDFFKYDTIRRQIAGNLYVSETKTVIIIDKDAEVIKNIDTESTVDIQDLIDDVGVLYGARQVVAEAQVSLDRTIFVLNNSSVTYYDKAINAVDLIISEEERYVHGPVHCLLYILKDRIVLLHMKEYQETYPHLPDSQAIFDDSEEITKGPIRCRFYASQKKLLVVLDENIERLMLGPHYTIPAPPAQQRPAEPLPDDRELCGPDCDDDDEQNSITINVNVRKDFFKYDTIRRQIAGDLYVSETKTVIIIDKDAEVIKNIDTESTVDIQDLIDDVGVLYGARQVVAEAQVSLDRTIFVLNNSSVTYYDKVINAVDLIISEEERYVHGPVHCLLYILKDRIVLLHMKEYQETYPHLPDSQAIFDDSEEITKGPIRCRFYASQKKLLVVLDENIERLMLGPHYTIPAPPAQQRPAEPLPDDRELCGPDCDDDDEQNSITINVNVRKDFFKYDTIRRQIAGNLYVSETKTVIIIDKDAEVIKNIDTESTVDIQDLIDDVGVLYGARQVVAEAQVSLDRTIFVLNNSSVTYYDKAINAVDLIISEEERYVHGPVHCLLYILKDRIVLLHMKEYQETYPHLPDSQAIFDDSEEITKGPIRCRFYASQKKLLVVLDENIERLMLGPHYTIPAPPAQQRPAEPLPDDRELCGPDCDDDDEQNSITINVNVRKDFFKYDTIRRQIAGNLYVSETKTVIIIDKDAEVIKNIDTESTVDIQDLIDDVGVLYGARQVVAEAQVSLDRTIFVLNNSSVTYYDKAINAVDLIISEEERYVHGPVHCLLYILKDRIVLLHMKEYQETYPHLPDSQAIFDDSEEITKGPIRCRFYASQKKLLVVLDENIERLMLGPHYTIPAPPAQQRPAEPLPDDRELCGPDCDDDDEQNSITINVNVRKDFFKYDTIRRQIAGNLYVSETKTVIIIDKDAEVIKNIDTESTVDIQDLIDDVGVLYGARQVVAEAQVSLDRTIFVLNNSSVTYYDKAINAVDLIISEEERYVHGPVHCLLYILKDRIVLLHMKEYQETYPHLPDSQAIFDDSEEITKGPIRCRFYASQKKLLVVLDENIERLMLGPHYTIPAPPAQQRPAEPLPDDRELCGPDCDDDDEQNSITINVNVRKDFFKYDTIRRQIAGNLYVSETKTVIIIDKDAEVIKNIDTESTVDIQDLIDDVGVLYGARQVVAEAQVSLDRTIFVLNNSSVTYYDKAINAVDLIISEEERYVHGPVHCLLYILKDRIVLLHMKEYQDAYPHLPISHAIFDDSEVITKGPIWCRFYASQRKLLFLLDENIFRFDGTLFVNSDFAMPVSNDEVVCEYDCDDQNGISIDVNVQEDVRAEEVIRRDIRGVFYFSKYKTMFVMDKDVLVARRFRFHNFVDISGIISAFDEPVEHQVLSETRISLGMTLFIIRSHLQPYLRKTVSASELFTKEELIVQGPVHGLLYIVGNRITFVYMEKYLDLYPHYPDVGTIFNKTEEIVNGPMQCNFYISHSKIIVVVNENLKNHIQPNQVPSPHSSRFGFD